MSCAGSCDSRALHASRDLRRAEALRANIDCEGKSAPTRPLSPTSTFACFGDDFDALRLPGYDAYGQHRAPAHA
jgi:hypothetical protein